jgi:uncharacterized SAM-binding protein YcdF (DUF218 family)
VADRTKLPDTEFVLRRGKRGVTGLWIVALAAVVTIAVISLAVAIAQPPHDGQGGAGNIVVPSLGIAFSLLGLGFAVGQWWDDETHFRVLDDALAVRHGTRHLRGRAVYFETNQPVAVTSEGGSDQHILVEQGDVRMNVGNAREILPLQYGRWVTWMRQMGIAVDRRLEHPGR